MRERRGMKFPDYITAPVETGWRVASTCVSPVDRALFCSRIDLSSGKLAWALASGAGVNRRVCTVASRRRGWEVGAHVRERRGMKFPGYTTAPVETGWRVASTVVSPVDRALFRSRIDLSSGGLAWARASALTSGRCPSTWLHRGVLSTGLGGRCARASPVGRALLCSRID